MLSEIRQTQKDEYCIIPQSSHIHKDSKQGDGFQRLWEGAVGSYCLMSAEFQFKKMKSFGDWLSNSVNVLDITGLYVHLKNG